MSQNRKKLLLKTNFKLLLLLAAILLTCFTGFSEEYGIGLVRCPLCGNEYCIHKLASYSDTGSESDPNPDAVVSSPCPRCLYCWSGGLPRKLDLHESRRVNAAIASWPQSLTPAERSHILAALDNSRGPYDAEDGEEEDIIDKNLTARCLAAREGKALPAFTAPKPLPMDSELAEERAIFLKALPSLLKAQRAGKPTLLHLEDPRMDNEIATIQNAAQTMKGNPQALEFALRWALTLHESDLLDQHSVYGDVFVNFLLELAAVPATSWPNDIDPAHAHSPFVTACLDYIHDSNASLPARMRQELAADPHNQLLDITVKACIAKHDRGAAAILAEQLSSPSDKFDYYAITDYYKAVGVSSDIPALAHAARFFQGSDRNVDNAQMCEGAIRRLQLKALLGGETLVWYRDGSGSKL